MSKWQPIETAPKDGTPILLWGGRPDGHSDYSDFVTGVSDFPSPVVAGWWRSWGDGKYGRWFYCSYDSGVYGEWEMPTHWLPLPKRPNEPKAP